MTDLETTAILIVLNDYAERHLKTNLVYQVAKAELQSLLDEVGKWRKMAEQTEHDYD